MRKSYAAEDTTSLSFDACNINRPVNTFNSPIKYWIFAAFLNYYFLVSIIFLVIIIIFKHSRVRDNINQQQIKQNKKKKKKKKIARTKNTIGESGEFDVIMPRQYLDIWAERLRINAPLFSNTLRPSKSSAWMPVVPSYNVAMRASR